MLNVGEQGFPVVMVEPHQGAIMKNGQNFERVTFENGHNSTIWEYQGHIKNKYRDNTMVITKQIQQQYGTNCHSLPLQINCLQ